MAAADTKTLILNSAEQMFADIGYGAASLRQIIASAGVNLAAVHYHFGSKEALFEAVISRHLQPLNKERLALLDACLEQAKNGDVPLEKLVEALVGPALRLSRDPQKGGEVFMRLMGRVMSEPNEALQAIINRQFNEVAERFVEAFAKALPHLSRIELFWRIHFMAGAMAHTLCDSQRLKYFSGGLCDPKDVDGISRRLVGFLAAGLRAPASDSPSADDNRRAVASGRQTKQPVAAGGKARGGS